MGKYCKMWVKSPKNAAAIDLFFSLHIIYIVVNLEKKNQSSKSTIRTKTNGNNG